MPWVFAAMHAPWYNSNDHHQDEGATLRHKAELESALAAAGVSAVFAGHVHAYERTKPVCFDEADATGIVYVTVGLTGQWYVNEFSWGGWWSLGRHWTAVRDASQHGFGHLTIVNDTMARFLFKHNGGETRAADEVWIPNRFLANATCGQDPPAKPTDCLVDTAAAVDARVAAAQGDVWGGSAVFISGARRATPAAALLLFVYTLCF